MSNTEKLLLHKHLTHVRNWLQAREAGVEVNPATLHKYLLEHQMYHDEASAKVVDERAYKGGLTDPFALAVHPDSHKIVAVPGWHQDQVGDVSGRMKYRFPQYIAVGTHGAVMASWMGSWPGKAPEYAAYRINNEKTRLQKHRRIGFTTGIDCTAPTENFEEAKKAAQRMAFGKPPTEEKPVALARTEVKPKASLHPSIRGTRFGAKLREIATSGNKVLRNLVGSLLAGEASAPRLIKKALASSDSDQHQIDARKYNWDRMAHTLTLDGVVSKVLRASNAGGLDEDTLYHRAGSDTNRGKVVQHLLKHLPTIKGVSQHLGEYLTPDHLGKSLLRLREGARDRIQGLKTRDAWDATLKKVANTHDSPVFKQALKKERDTAQRSLKFSREEQPVKLGLGQALSSAGDFLAGRLVDRQTQKANPEFSFAHKFPDGSLLHHKMEYRKEDHPSGTYFGRQGEGLHTTTFTSPTGQLTQHLARAVPQTGHQPLMDAAKVYHNSQDSTVRSSIANAIREHYFPTQKPKRFPEKLTREDGTPPTWETPENIAKLDGFIRGTKGQTGLGHLAPLADWLAEIHHPLADLFTRTLLHPGGNVTLMDQGGGPNAPATNLPTFTATRWDGTAVPGVRGRLVTSDGSHVLRFATPFTHQGEVEDIAKTHHDPMIRHIAQRGLDDPNMDWSLRSDPRVSNNTPTHFNDWTD